MTTEEGCFRGVHTEEIRIRDSNSEAGSCRSTKEYKESYKYNEIQRSTTEYENEKGAEPMICEVSILAIAL
jgi:hypothetical protein